MFNLLITARMGNGTIQAKLCPLSRLGIINNIYFLRKTPGPPIDKVQYIILPKLCKYSIFNFVLTPIILAKLTRKVKPHFVVAYHVVPYGIFAYCTFLVTGVRYIIGQTGIYIQDLAKTSMHWLWIKRVIQHSTKLLVPGNQSEEFWISKGIEKVKITQLHSTVDVQKYHPTTDAKIFDYIFVGRFAPEKRMDVLILAFSKVLDVYPSAKLLLVGDGYERESVKEQLTTNKLDAAVQMTGFQLDVNPFLAKSRFVVLSSDSEGLPCSLMEAMSCGLVPITTDVGNIKDLVIDGFNGYCVTKNSVLDFAQAMIKAYSLSEKEFNLLSRNARDTIVRDHSFEHAMDLWKSILV